MAGPSKPAQSAGIKTPKAEVMLGVLFRATSPITATTMATRAGYHERSGYHAIAELMELGYAARVGRVSGRYTFSATPAGKDAWMLMLEELGAAGAERPQGQLLEAPGVVEFVAPEPQPERTKGELQAAIWSWIGRITYTHLDRASRDQLDALHTAIQGLGQ